MDPPPTGFLSHAAAPGNERLDPVLQLRLKQLASTGRGGLLKGGKKGIEKESLRVARAGCVAQTPHSRSLGSALTHPYLTTDYSEALLELRTPAFSDIADTLRFLGELHQFVYANLEGEILWGASMPCRLQGEDSIPIAQYGRSNVGTMKHVYRRGLAYRYGRVMQAIAGVHFNYSPPDAFWPVFQACERDTRPLGDFISGSYFALLRNFQRCGWLVCYLFGSSPAMDRSFAGDCASGLAELDAATCYIQHATSLRMSDIGYHNRTQASLDISCNSLEEYIAGLAHATETPYPEYERIGTVVDGEYRQLNANILQIENEYYTVIRPKRRARSGEKPTLALKRRGVQYVEVRAVDVVPFDPSGVDESELRFLEALLVACLLMDSPPISAQEKREIDHNQYIVTRTGRDPSVTLERGGTRQRLQEWAAEICDAVQPVCELLDEGEPGRPYAKALEAQREAARDAERTPSAAMLDEMRRRRESFFEFGLRVSKEHERHYKRLALPESRRRYFAQLAAESIRRQKEIEAADRASFDEYLRRYFAQTSAVADGPAAS